MKLEDISIHAFIQTHNIKNETGTPIDFRDHMFLFDIYRDFSPKLVVMKAAQIGATTMEVIKTIWGVKNRGLDAIYTLPTYEDVNTMVGSKVNRIISQNPVLQEWTKDRDTIDQKQIGDHYIHFRGTWTQKAAIMVTSDWNLYDEIDASKQDVIEQYATRLQHSKYKYEHYFSHPSAQGTGIDKYWERSDQKHWFITCKACSSEQYLSWPQSINAAKGTFVCKKCGGEIMDDDRRRGRWVARFRDREYSGYWVPLLICPWVSAKEILSYQKDKSEEYFYNKVLGLPYIGGGNKLTKAHFVQNLTTENLYPENPNERVIIGVDTGKQLHYVVGGKKGIFYYSTAKDYDEIESLLHRWPRAIAVIDQGGDLIGSRKLREAYPGRVFLCTFGADRKTQQLVRWGSRDENGAVTADRNRTIQLVVDEFVDRRLPVMGSETDWYDYWLHWNALTRIKEIDQTSGAEKRKIWVRNGDDHWALATVYWRVGFDRFCRDGEIIMPQKDIGIPIQPEVYPDKTMDNMILPDKHQPLWLSEN